MQELIKFSENKVYPISARELYSVLYDGDMRGYSRWIKTYITSGRFGTKDVDYQQIVKCDLKKPGRKLSPDFNLSMEFSKELSLLTKTEKGKLCRNYFIEVEKRAKESLQPILPQNNTNLAVIPKTLSEALLLAYNLAKQNEEQTQVIEQSKPKLEGYNQFLHIPDKAISIKEAAKLLNCYRKDKPKELFGQNSLFGYMRFIGLLQKNNLPYQQYSKFFMVKEVLRIVSDENKEPKTLSVSMTLILPIGLERLRLRLVKDGYKFAENSNQLEII